MTLSSQIPPSLIPYDGGGYQNFKIAASLRMLPEALSTLTALPVADGLKCCLRLAVEDWASLEALAARATGPDRGHFCARLAKDGFVPQNVYNGVGFFDYHFARTLLVRARSESQGYFNSKWPLAMTAAKSRLFYPEIRRLVASLPDRIVHLANLHNRLGPHNGLQIALFSLGGYLSHSAADSSTQPNGTTCFSFARGVYHAAGIDVIGLNNTPTDGRVIGFKVQFENVWKAAYVPCQANDKPALDRGDVFHIRGKDKVYEDKHTEDSSHVGIVTVPGEDQWTTVEGGGPGHVTRELTRRLIPSSTKGKWRLHNDEYTGKDADGNTIERPVVGFIRALKTGKVMALDPTPLPPGV
jgi:hypothetical protein